MVSDEQIVKTILLYTSSCIERKLAQLERAQINPKIREEATKLLTKTLVQFNTQVSELSLFKPT